MKTKYLFIALAALALVGCSKEKEQEEASKPEFATYVGTVTVVSNDNSFDNENIEVSFNPSERGDTCSLTIFQIRFVPQMPVTVDVTIPGVAVAVAGDKTVLSCDSVVPLAMGGEYPRYTVTDFRGEMVGDEMAFSLNFGSSPTSFRGTRKED